MSIPTHEDVSTQVAFLGNLAPGYLACRQSHRVPRFAPTRNGRVPAGITMIGPYADGTFDVLRRCESCGLVLVNHTNRDGVMLEGRPRRRYPQGFLAKGIGRISRTLATSVGYDQVADALIAAARKPAAEQE